MPTPLAGRGVDRRMFIGLCSALGVGEALPGALWRDAGRPPARGRYPRPGRRLRATWHSLSRRAGADGLPTDLPTAVLRIIQTAEAAAAFDEITGRDGSTSRPTGFAACS